MNVEKTKTMIFGTRHRLKEVSQTTFHVKNRSPECVYKYLGTYLDSELIFVKQSNETIRSISYKLYYMGKMLLNMKILLKLSKSCIQPCFDYIDIFLETTTVRQYDKLARLQI